MMKRVKGVLSILLCLMIVISSLSLGIVNTSAVNADPKKDESESEVIKLNKEEAEKIGSTYAAPRAASIDVPANATWGHQNITGDTVMTFKGGATITGSNSPGISIANGVTLTIILTSGTVNVRANGTGYAGIRLPANAKLIVKGNGTLNAIGGNGSASGNGENGTYDGNRPGGDGGEGGSAPGSGIGGNGGRGGTAGRAGKVMYWNGDASNGEGGQAGGNGTAGEQAGTLYILGTTNVIGQAGSRVTNSSRSGGSGAGMRKNGDDNLEGGGAGGGAGGDATGSAGIGGSGAGGGAGGGGGAGMHHYSKKSNHGKGAAGGGGGQGVEAGKGGKSCGAYSATSTSDATDGSLDNPGQPGVIGPDNVYSGGPGGAGGWRGAPGTAGKIYKEYTAKSESRSSESMYMGGNSPTAGASIVFLSECTVELDDTSLVYTGSDIKPKVILKGKDGNEIPSKLNKNYKVDYSNCKDVGEATATISSLGLEADNYYLLVDDAVKKTIKYNIVPATDDDIKIDNQGETDCVYGKSFDVLIRNRDSFNKGDVKWEFVTDDTHKAEALFKDGDKTAVGESAKVIPTKVGKLKIRATIIRPALPNGKYNYNESIMVCDQDIEVTPKDITSATDIVFPKIPSQVYTGALIKPQYNNADYKTASIKYDQTADVDREYLVQDVDYSLDYGDATTNLNSTSYENGIVIIKGTGNYTGEKTQKFKIDPINIGTDDTFSMIIQKEFEFTGNAQTPLPTISISGNILPNTDYNLMYKDLNLTLTHEDLTNVGEKRITISPKSGNLTGTKTVDFKIVPADISKCLVSKLPLNVYFDAREIESRPELMYNGYLLTEDKTTSSTTNPDDYELSFTNHKLVGEATVTIKGVNNFKGETTTHYNVLQRPLYILPDIEQWKYYGQDDMFGIKQDKIFPTYTTFIKKLNSEGTKETEERMPGSDVDPIASLSGFKATVEGNLSRVNEHEIGTYKYLIGGLKLKDDSSSGNSNRNYVMKIVDDESYYTVKEYVFDDVKATLDGTMGKNDWYVNNPAKLIAPAGFTISASRSLVSNEWKDSISFSDGDYSKLGVQYFLRNKATKSISVAFSENYKQDTIYPKGNVVVNDDAWAFYNSKTEFTKFLNLDAIGAIYGQDSLSQVRKTSYFLSEKILTIDELNSIKVLEDFAEPSKVILGLNADFPIPIVENSWINSAQFDMAINDYNEKQLIVYGRVEDFAGNVTYVSSEGIVFDKDAPLLKAEYKYDEVWTTDVLAKITGTVADNNSGLKDRYVAYQIDDQAQQIIHEVGDFSINELPDGNYSLVISAWDKADNKAVPVNFHVMKDTKEPRILLDANTTQISTKQQVKFTLDIGASKEAKLEVSYNNGNWQVVEGGTAKDFFVNANGTYKFRVTNGAGITSKESSITFTKIDNQTPNVEVYAKDSSKKDIYVNGTTNKQVTVTFVNKVENLGQSIYEYSLDDGSSWNEVSANLDREAQIPVFEYEGKYKLKVRITAQNGLLNEKEFSFMIDKTVPIGNITVKDASTKSLFAFLDIFRNKKQDVSINANDSNGTYQSGIKKVEYYILAGKKVANAPTDESFIEYMVDGKWQEGSSCTINPSEQYIVYFKMTDLAGNIAYMRSDRIVIDDANPIISVVGNDKATVNEALLKVTVKDDNPGLKSVKYTVDSNAEQDGSDKFNIRITENGEHIVIIKAEDLSGNIAETRIVITVNDAKPTIKATLNAFSTDKEKGIDVEATYGGEGNINHIYVKVDNGDFADITSTIKKSDTEFKGEYIAKENGLYTFRVMTTTGAFAETTVQVNGFVATDVLAKVIARNTDGTGYKSGDWTNQDVRLSFSNSIANLDGLSHYLSLNNGSYDNKSATNGYVNVDVDKTALLSYKVGLVDNSKISQPIDYQVNIDKINPTGKIVIKDKSWNALEDLIYNISLGAFFNEKQEVTISGEDMGGSGVDKVYYFVENIENLPENLKGNMDASTVEDMAKDRWVEGDKVLLNPNGSYVVLAKIVDKASNVSYLSTNGIIFDNVSPNIKSDIDQTDWYIDNTTPITFELKDAMTDIKEVIYKIGTTTKTPSLTQGKFSVKTDEFPQGESTIEVIASDKAGNKISSLYQLKKDAIKPKISAEDITTNKDFVVRERKIKVTPTADASQILRVEVKEPEAGGWKDITNTYKDGYYAKEVGVYYFRVINGAGVASDPVSITLGDISQDVPILTYIAQNKDGSPYLENSWVSQDVYVKFLTTTKHKIKQYLYKIDNGSYNSLTIDVDNSASFASQEGNHQYTMKCIADNGLESEEISVWISVDKASPKIRVNSDLNTWVKETTLLEVEVIDDLSGISEDGYSFDGGHSWQSTKKENVYANKIVDVQAKDAVSNISSKGVPITKIDSQGPTALSLSQVGNEPAKSRSIKAKVKDYKDITENDGSGVKDVYIMTSFPYKNGVFAPNPSTTYSMEMVGDTWETEKPVSVAYNGTSSIWLVTTDNVDNIKIYSSTINNMIGSGDNEGNTEDPSNPSNPSNPDNPGTGGATDPTNPGGSNNPTDPSNPLNPGIGGITEPTKPGGTNSNQNSNTGYVNGQISSNRYQNIIDNSNQTNVDNQEDVNNAQLNKDVLNYLDSLKTKKGDRGLYVLIIPWILIIILTILALHRHRKFRLRKKELENLIERGEEDEKTDS